MGKIYVNSQFITIFLRRNNDWMSPSTRLLIGRDNTKMFHFIKLLLKLIHVGNWDLPCFRLGIGLSIRFKINLEGITFHLRERRVIKNIITRLQKWSKICILGIGHVLCIRLTEVTLTDDSDSRDVSFQFKSSSEAEGFRTGWSTLARSLPHISGLISGVPRVFNDEGWLRF